MEDSAKYMIPVIANLIRYVLIAGIPFLIFYRLWPKKFSRQKIQERWSKQKDWIRELIYSGQSLIVFSGMSMLVIFTPVKGYTRIYQDLDAYPLWWIPVSIIMAVWIHDTYFYWMHRTIHHPKLFRKFHLVHHRSTNPTPLTSHAFNLSESFLEAIIIPIILWIIPMHLISIIGFVLLALAFNVYGHLGYEIAPRWFRRSFLFEIMNTSVHHNLHHEKFKGNYGYYFRIWDRLMGTENPAYVRKYDAIQAKRFPKPDKHKNSTRNRRSVSSLTSTFLKKVWILPILLLASVSLSAQTLDNPGTPEQRAQKITQEMLQTLPLDSVQLKPVHSLNLKYARKAQREIIEQELSKWSILMKGHELNKQKEKELKVLLSEAQWDQYLKMKSTRSKDLIRKLFE